MTEEQRPSRWEDLAFDKDGRLIDVNGPVEFVTFGPPPPITWTPVMDIVDVFGLRAATMTSRGPTYDLRIASEVFQDSGGWYVHLVGEDQWWDWLAIPDHRRPERPGKAVCWPTRYVWAERREPTQVSALRADASTGLRGTRIAQASAPSVFSLTMARPTCKRFAT